MLLLLLLGTLHFADAGSRGCAAAELSVRGDSRDAGGVPDSTTLCLASDGDGLRFSFLVQAHGAEREFSSPRLVQSPDGSPPGYHLSWKDPDSTRWTFRMRAAGIEACVAGGRVVSSLCASVRQIPEDLRAWLASVPLPFGEGMTRPVLQGPPFKLRDDALPTRGLLIVKCTLTTVADARDCKLIKGLNDAVDGAVMLWLAEQRWTPVTFEGRAITVKYVFNFLLR